MLLVLKIPVVYLGAVVWWAIRAEPRPEEPAALVPSEPPAGPAPTRPAPTRSRARIPRRPRLAGPSRRPGGGRAEPVRAEARR